MEQKTKSWRHTFSSWVQLCQKPVTLDFPRVRDTILYPPVRLLPLGGNKQASINICRMKCYTIAWASELSPSKPCSLWATLGSLTTSLTQYLHLSNRDEGLRRLNRITGRKHLAPSDWYTVMPGHLRATNNTVKIIKTTSETVNCMCELD